MTEQLTPSSDAPPEYEQQPTVPERELLVGHYRTDGTFKSTEQLKTEYVRLTDNIIYEATNGIDVEDPNTGEMVKSVPDYIVWIDKSARPVSWLFRDLWPTLAADADGNVPEMPESKFVNIDRNQWVNSIDAEGVGASDINSISPSIVRSLRSIFLSNQSDRKDGLTDDIDTAPSLFDGKTVLLVDEVQSSGRTLEYAKSFFKRAFPDAKVAGTYWMGAVTTIKKGATIVNADLPVWYSDKTPMGRGIGDRNVDKSLQSENSTQRLGAYFLSVALGSPDPKSEQLRKELHQLAADARDHSVLVVPSAFRDVDDAVERALRLNEFSSVSEYMEARKRANT